MTEYITTFLLPLLSLFTLGFIASVFWFVFAHKKHESESGERHKEAMNFNRSMSETLKKVDKNISDEVIPKLGEIFKEKTDETISLSPEAVSAAIEKIGAKPNSISDDGELILAGWIHDDQKVFFLISIDTESKDLMIEGYSNSVPNINAELATELLTYNEKMKVSGLCIERVGGYNLLKTQQLVDAPDDFIHLKTLDFVMNSLMETQVEIQEMLQEKGVDFEFFPPEKYLPMRFKAKVPNKGIQSTAGGGD